MKGFNVIITKKQLTFENVKKLKNWGMFNEKLNTTSIFNNLQNEKVYLDSVGNYIIQKVPHKSTRDVLQQKVDRVLKDQWNTTKEMIFRKQLGIK